jgi:hypothetical protein
MGWGRRDLYPAIYRLSSSEKSVTLTTDMVCVIVALIIGVALTAIASKAISGAVYRHLIRTGHANPASGQAISYIASFILIFATVVIGGWILLSSFRFVR